MSTPSTGHREAAGERMERGMAMLRLIGDHGFDGPVNRLAEISPDMARFTVEYPYGDVLSRPGLDLRLRQICTISTLIALGSVQPQLRFHMEGLLNVGGKPQDLVEIMFLSTAILGFPAAIDAIGIVREIFAERPEPFVPASPIEDDGIDRHRRGLDAFRALFGTDPSDYVAPFSTAAPELARWSIEFLFGDILSRDGLEGKARQLAVMSMLATIGNRADALRLHVMGALNCGATPTEVVEALIQISVYAGFPAALNAFTVARDILENPPERSEVAPHPVVEAPESESSTLRRQRGLAALATTSNASGTAVVRSFDDIAPTIGQMIVDHCYGDIFHRGGLEPKTRELTACAALAGHGAKTTETPLRVHINAALTAGASRDEVVETLLNIIPYSGYPAAQQAMRIAAEEFARRGV
jgi:4-carboxymuconolactone decarboxylase